MKQKLLGTQTGLPASELIMGGSQLGQRRGNGTSAEEALQMLKSNDYDLVFASLPSPDRIITEDMLFEFRRQQSLVITASYPEYLFTGYDLNPICFLKEPFPMANFESAIGKFQSLVSCS